MIRSKAYTSIWTNSFNKVLGMNITPIIMRYAFILKKNFIYIWSKKFRNLNIKISIWKLIKINLFNNFVGDNQL